MILLKKLMSKKFKLAFIHDNGNECSLNAGVNKNKWSWWWSGSRYMYSGNENDMKQIVKNVINNTTVNIDTFSFSK